MLLICVIITIIAIVITLHLVCNSDFYLDTRNIWFAFMLLILVLLLGLIIIHMQNPTAMDVYQGKTTLEITYKNGVPVDSVVVWKGGKE